MQGLLYTATPGVHPEALLKANVAAIPKTLPVLSLAFVYHNIIPVISTSLEVRSLPPTTLPCLMFKGCTQYFTSMHSLPGCFTLTIPLSAGNPVFKGYGRAYHCTVAQFTHSSFHCQSSFHQHTRKHEGVVAVRTMSRLLAS